ncbi:hypothetical protein F5Y14DRAFT_450172 [Nemania sp. NC0429]|nr:hypothetical protein F5Y14DRAFT_450172 [Nemania sp. NC0429]
MPNHHEGSILGARSSTPDCGSHVHSAGFSHEPRRARSGSRPTEEIVRSAPREDAAVAEVRTWVLEVFHRRCHPDPESALEEFYWKGSDLHSQRRYLALRLRFRGEPYGYLIAHDIHDAVKVRKLHKSIEAPHHTRPRFSSLPRMPSSTFIIFFAGESRKRSHKHHKEATKQAKKTEKAQGTNTINTPCEEETTAHAARQDQPDTKASHSKARKKLAKIFHISPGAPAPPPPPLTPSSSSRAATLTIAATASPADGEDPFQDPIPALPTKAELKTEKARKKKERKEEKKRRRKMTARSPDSYGDDDDDNDDENPFRDPEPMRLIDADDFRLGSFENIVLTR